MAPTNPSSCSVSVVSGNFLVNWVGGATGVVNINVFESATGGTPLSGYSTVATLNGTAITAGTATVTGYTPIAGYWYAVVVHNTAAAGNDLAGPKISPAYQNYPAGVMPTFTLTSLSATRMVVTWSGGSGISSINFQTVIADATNMTGNTNFYNFGTYMATGSGTQNMDTTYTPGYSFSASMLVTFQNSTTQSSGVLTPGIQLASPTVVTSGGTLTTNGGQSIVSFTSSGTFKLIYPANTTMTYLVVGGGGGGGYTNCAGGGGAGGAVQATAGIQDMTLHGSYTVTVGNGGAGGTSGPGVNGSDSSFNSTTGTGGGGGGSIFGPPARNGIAGGCGGGGSYSAGISGGIGGAGSQGFAGGNGSAIAPAANNGGGGGGMGSVGVAANYISVAAAGNGGDGKTYTIGGNSYTVSGGGGGGGDSGYGAGGSGIGGQGGYYAVFCTAGATNTGSGGGGGGGGQVNPSGAAGGSGVVRIAYQTNVSLNPDLRPFQPRSPVGRTNYYKHTGRGMGRYMGDWMDTNIV